MKSFILVNDAVYKKPLCLIDSVTLYNALDAVFGNLTRLETQITGGGTENSPIEIGNIGQILGYIKRRNSFIGDREAEKTLYFNFFGTVMYQFGNRAKAEDGKSYYVGLPGEAVLSYPAMLSKMRQDTTPASNVGDLSNILGRISLSTKYELLAVASLLIGEGRRNLLSVLVHLLLFDLISNEVRYGGSGEKIRTLETAIHKPDSFNASKKVASKLISARYDGKTAAGDSPMSQKNSTLDFQRAHASALHEQTPTKNRYFDKTVSLLIQWIIYKYRAENFKLIAGGPEQRQAAERSVNELKTDLMPEKNPNAVVKGVVGNNKNAWSTVRKELQAKLHGDALKNQILSHIRAYLQDRVEEAAGTRERVAAAGQSSASDATGFLEQAIAFVYDNRAAA